VNEARPRGFDWHGRRHGKKLRPGLQALVDTLLPKLRIDDGRQINAIFQANTKDVWLEIGFGGGEHLAEQAARNPDIGFIGCEPYINGVARLLSFVDRDGLENVRIVDDDDRPLLDQLPDASLGRAYLLFADPWPKARHNKRRFMNPENLDRLSRVMKDGAELVFASDHPGHVEWALEVALKHPDFHWTARQPNDWRIPPVDWVQTRYEKKALSNGIKSSYLLFERQPRTAINP